MEWQYSDTQLAAAADSIEAVAEVYKIPLPQPPPPLAALVVSGSLFDHRTGIFSRQQHVLPVVVALGVLLLHHRCRLPCRRRRHYHHLLRKRRCTKKLLKD